MAFDLKPLSKETIQKMGYSTHDLWVVKIREDVFGPFETKSLKHYSQENEALFVEALATRLDNSDWQLFFGHAVFSKQLHPGSHANTFWLLVEGQKIGPLTKKDVENKLAEGTIPSTDLVSIDDGQSWQKIYQFSSWGQKGLSSEALPTTPQDESFEKAKLELTDPPPQSAGQTLASLAFLGHKKDQTMVLNLEEIDLKSLNDTEVSRSLKWAIPLAFCAIVSIVGVGYFVLKPTPATDLAGTDENEVIDVSGHVKKRVKGLIPSYRANHMPLRAPASIPSGHQERSALTQQSAAALESQYPTHIEVHENNDRHPSNEPDPLLDPVQDVEPAPEATEAPIPQEHSLLNEQTRTIEREPASLDRVMNPDIPVTEEPPRDSQPQPAVEEAADF